MIIEKDIARVSVGSYVVSIAKQRGTNKIKQQGWIRNLNVIEKLIELGVERVLIDTSKRLNEEISESSDKIEQLATAPTKQKNTSLPPRKTPIKESFAESIGKAKAIFHESKQIQKKIFDNALCGRQIDLAPIKEITHLTTEAIFENPDALACIINIRKKDEYLLEHSTSVSILMSIFSRYLNVNMSTAKELSIGAFLHDVGKIKVPDEILNKPGKLTTEEFEVMKTHVIHSVDIIRGIDGIDSSSLEVAGLHHEKLDGSGYPHNLAAEKINQYGRMLTICDIFDALTATRVYKDGMAQVKAFAILLGMAEKKMLDFSLVNQFIKCMGVYPIGSLVKLSSNQLAVVESRNIDNPIKPKVKAFYSVSQSHFLESRNIDLSSDNQEHIEKGVRADDFDLDMNKILEFLIMEG